MLNCPHCRTSLKTSDLELDACPHCGAVLVPSNSESSLGTNQTIAENPDDAADATTAETPTVADIEASKSAETDETFVTNVVDEVDDDQTYAKTISDTEASDLPLDSESDKTIVVDSGTFEKPSAGDQTIADSGHIDATEQTFVSDEFDADRTFANDTEKDSGSDQSAAIDRTFVTEDVDLTANLNRSMADDWSIAIKHDDAPTTSIRAKERFEPSSNSSLVIKTRAVQSTKVPTETDEAEYEILGILGKGGMGVVYEARQTSIDRSVAVKMLGEKTKSGAQNQQKFLAEAVVTGELDHPNVVPIYDVGVNDRGSLFYSMKKVQGTPWSKVIKDNSQAENLDILLRVADAVAFAHSRGIVHRDLKPDNVMLGEFGEVLVMDWGLAQPTESFRKKNTVANIRSLGGTPSYMAPEMVLGPVEAIGPASDTYLLGAILYEILTGKPPHTASNVSQALVYAGKNVVKPPKETNELTEIAMRAMETDPEDRYPSVRDFQHDIREYQSHIESVALSGFADDYLRKSRETHEYEGFSRALFAFEEASSLWAGNTSAQRGAAAARLEYAQTALNKADFDLAASLLDADNPDHTELLQKVITQQQERAAHKRRLRRAKLLVRGLVAMVLAVVSIGLVLVMKAEKTARRERDVAEQQRQLAESETLRANDAAEKESLARSAADKSAEEERQAKHDAVKARDEAVASQKQEEAAKIAAVDARKEAEQAKQEETKAKDQEIEARHLADKARVAAVAAKEAEEYEAYIARIGLAAAKIDENAFDSARVLLEDCDPKFRQWEWGRLMYLCSQSEKSFDVREPASCLALAPDNQTFVTGGPSGVAWMWNAQDGKLLHESRHGGDVIHAVAFSPDGRLLATGGDNTNSFIKIWDAKTGQPIERQFGPPASEDTFETGHTQTVTSVQFSHDGRRLLTASLDGTARLWDVESGQQIQRLFGHNWWVRSATFRREQDTQGKAVDEKRIVTTGQDGTAIVWSDETGQWTDDTQIRQGIPFRGHKGPVFCARFTPDGKHVVSGGYDRRILIWEPEAIVEFDFRNLAEELAPTETTFQELTGHTDTVRSIRFSQDGSLIVSSGRDNTVRVWDIGSKKLIRTFRGHGSAVAAADFSADGRWILSAGGDGQAKRWSLDGDDEIQTLQGRRLAGHTNAVLGASFSPDGQQVVTASQDRYAKSWSAESGDVTRAFFEGHQFLSSSVVFMPDGRRLITSAMDNTARVWNLASGTEEFSLSGTGRKAAVAASPDGRWIVTGSDQSTVKLWDAGNGKLVREFTGHAHEVTAVAITTANGGLVLSGDEAGRCWLWDANTGQQIRRLTGKLGGHSGRIVAAAFTIDGSRALTASNDRTVAQWDVETGEELVDRVLKHPAAVTAMALAPDGGFALTGCLDGTVRYWEIQSGKLLHSFVDVGGSGAVSDNLRSLMEERAWSVADLSRQSHVREELIDKLLSGKATVEEATISQLAKAFDVATTKLHESVPVSVSLSPAGMAAATYAADGKVRVWEVASGREVLNQEYPFLIWSAAFDPQAQGSRLAVVGGNQTHLLDAATGQVAMAFGPHGAVASANFSPDGNRLVTGSWDSSARIWDATSGRVLAKLEGAHAGAINSCVFSPDADGRFVLTSSDDGTAKLWEIVTQRHKTSPDAAEVEVRIGRVVRTYAGHTARVGFATFSPDGRWVLTASDDKTAALYETSAPATSSEDEQHIQPACVLQGHEWEVLCIAASADGTRVITGSADNTARVWDLEIQEDGHVKAAPRLLLDGHTSSVTCVAFSPLRDKNNNGHWDPGETNAVRAITSSRDNSVKLWDTTVNSSRDQDDGTGGLLNATEILTLTEHDRTVTSVAFSNDGRRILSASRDGRAIVWKSVDWSGP
ncbi:Serine/threonine-protein kinase PknD [Symmachiella macrocystis]|uniref:Serine/threonine-protein kinase PknD n=1 Tax=Symmachiella macrocystis TaxID=2527985 RepID=A0A5C6B0J5_9PLAN|nr:protein kinase [Symmachiella macrocystis]TWU05297.1 Serine/threonine-protein kinase PknD [Symmachiella macrocystis]